jgi:hypothetical protein
VTLSDFTGYHMNPLIKCGKTLSGNASRDGGCTATITGTLKGKKLNMEWHWADPCTGEVTTFTGTMKYKTGPASGTWSDPCCGSGPFTATRTG